MSGHTHENYGDFSHFEINDDGLALRLACTACPPEDDEDKVIMEWWSLPVNVADLIKAMSQHEVDMDRSR